MSSQRHISFLPLWTVVSLLLVCWGCSGGADQRSAGTENREAKALLQGVWIDSETEEVSFWAKGDTIYYADSLSQPSAFYISGDSLYLTSTNASYAIEKQSSHVFWFRNQVGDVVKLEKSDDAQATSELQRGIHEPVMTYTEVVKTDSVVNYNGERYHWYIAINPTKYKVLTTVYNADGVEVAHVYFDNIIHVSVFHGQQRLFSSDIRKQQYAKLIPKKFLEQSVLSNMEFEGVDANGFHFVSTVCVPDGATCYKVRNVVGFDGRLSKELLEY